MTLLYVKALHIIFVVTWFSGLFYIVRLFIYHTEANGKVEPEKSILKAQFSIMEKRLWNFITVPSMYLTLATGIWLAWDYFAVLANVPWLIMKLSFVLVLVFYHLKCGAILKKLQNETYTYSSFQLRLWNEVATILLVAIVFIIILKTSFDWIWGLAGFLIFAFLLWLAAFWYKARRELDEIQKKNQKNAD